MKKNFKDFKKEMAARLMLAQHAIEFIGICEVLKFEMLMNYLNIDKLLDGR